MNDLAGLQPSGDMPPEHYRAQTDYIVDHFDLFDEEPLQKKADKIIEAAISLLKASNDLFQIVDFDPEVMLLGDAAYGVTPEQVAARPGWDVLTAVKNGDVRPIDDVIVTRPGPRLVEGIRALALAIHPDLVLPTPAP